MHRIFRLSILLFLISVLLAGCGAPPPRLQESGLNSRFSFSDDVPFDEYLLQTKHMILKVRGDINQSNREVILNANLPFEMKPDKNKYPCDKNGRYENGVLLIHGLSDSPYFMKALARHFQQKGFLVRTILLPGHGTVPGDLLHISYQEWIKATQYGVHQMEPLVKNLYLGGFSTGGALCVHHALNHTGIRGLFLFAPALGIDSPWAFTAVYLKNFTKWLDGAREDRDYAKYESFAVNGAAQLYHLTRAINADFATGKRLLMPVFAAMSMDDVSVDVDKAIKVFKAYASSPKSRFILYRRSEEKEQRDTDTRLIFRNSSYPKERITGFSHISLLIPPEDPHYGKNGDYKSCLHYRKDSAEKTACEQDPNIWMGEITKENLKRHPFRRLTYNPRHAELMRDIDVFLKNIPKD
jgi:esterase/lipase